MQMSIAIQVVNWGPRDNNIKYYNIKLKGPWIKNPGFFVYKEETMLTKTRVVKPLGKDAVLTLEEKTALIKAKVARAEASAQSLAEFAQAKAKSAERSVYTSH